MTDKKNLIKEKVEKEMITKREVLDIKPMYEEEAILQLELFKKQSFMYLDAIRNRMCLLYKRGDGNYGIVEADYLL